MINIHKENSQPLYEANFHKISSMLPDIKCFEHVTLLSEDRRVQLCVDVLERTPYTTLINLTTRYASKSNFIPSTKIQVRVYYDARVAEVLKIQNQKMRNPRYKYPNEKMYLPDEKRQGNRLLAEMLNLCRKDKYMKTYISQPMEIDD